MAWWEAALSGAASGITSKILGTDKPDYTAMKKGLQWRVADAKAAGISPVAALGANLTSPVITTGGSTGRAAAAGAVDGIMRDRLKRRDDLDTRLGEKEIELKQSQSRYWDAKAAEIDSQTARAGQGSNSSQDYSAQDSVIDPRPRKIKEASGAVISPGAGSPAQRGEDEYGEAWEIENLWRYLRDVALPSYKRNSNRLLGNVKKSKAYRKKYGGK